MSLKPGIYFNLPDAEYHNDTALSRSGMIDILDHHYIFWDKHLNPNRKRETTDAMSFGIWCEDYLINKKEFFVKYRITGESAWTQRQEQLTPGEFGRVQKSVEMARSDKFVDAISSNGYAHVAIVIRDEETGVLIRIQIDYLHYFMAFDYKRFKSINPDRIKYALAEYGCDMQDALYTRLIIKAKELLAAGDKEFKIYGKPDPAWLKKFIETPFQYFLFLCQASTPPYIFELISFEPDIIANANVQIGEATRKYARCLKEYGSKKPWPPTTGKIRKMGGSNMPQSIYYRGAEPIDL